MRSARAPRRSSSSRGTTSSSASNLPLKPQDADEPVWSVIRKLTGKIGESLTAYLHDIAKANPALEGIIDRMDFNATTHGQRDIDDDRQLLHFHVPNHGRLWKSLMRTHLGNYEETESELRREVGKAMQHTAGQRKRKSAK